MADPAKKVRGKLRTKAGCLPCRQQRKKCDEKTPICQRCSNLGKKCQWPTATELKDKRFGSRRINDSSSSIGSPSSGRQTPDSQYSATSVSDQSLISLESEALAHDRVRGDLEPFLGRHFVQEYFDLLLNPDSNVAFHDDWINDIQRLMQSSKSLKYSVLANAASHMHWIDGTPQMQELALSYYSRSVKDLSTTLASPSLPNNQFYATLMAIILLYLHGCMGRGTYGDIPFHLAAATKIIQLRFMNNPTVVLDRLFDRLAVESVMYQIFLVSTGLWTGDPTHANYRYDPHFWLQCEALLARSTLFPGQPAASNSPVLGVPCALFKLILSIKQLLSSPLLYDEDTVKHLKSEVAYWEAALTLQNEQAKRDRTICDDATLLYILIASLLCEQLSTSRELLFTGLPQPASSPSWQLQALAEILQRRHMDDEWGRCFVANWPVYTAGFFVTDLHHIGLVREDLSGRWARSNFAQVARYKNDLETTWTQRELVVDAVDDYTALGRLTLSK